MCKSCAHFLDEESFSFYSKVPAELAHTTYCESCFATNVAPELQRYEALLEKAKDILVYDKSQGKETRLLKRIEKPVQVKRCADYQETVLRLAFFAAQAGFNGIIDVDIKSEKVRDHAYQKTLYSGTAVPTQIQSGRLVKDRSIWQNPN